MGATSPTSTTSWRLAVRVMGPVPAGDPEWSGDAPDQGSSDAPDQGSSKEPDGLYNIGIVWRTSRVRSWRTLHKKAVKSVRPMQPGYVVATWANVDDPARDVDSPHRRRSRSVSSGSYAGIVNSIGSRRRGSGA
jgi:hypothetical protein